VDRQGLAVTTAFVFSGGGSLGAVQVGMLRALAEQRIRPDLLVGTSAGALNAAFTAACGAEEGGVAALARIWARLRSRSIFTVDPRHALAALAGRRDALCSNAGLRALLERHLPFDRLQDAPIPLVIVASDLLSGGEVALETGAATPAILASCAIPGVFPAINHAGRTLVDGALADNTAISQALRAGAETIYVLPSGYACALPAAPRSALGAATQAVTLLTHQRLVADVALYADRVDLVVLSPPCPLRVGPADFGHARELIRASYAHAVDVLARDGGRRTQPERRIALHTHRD
jgi:NTE family protein